MDIKYILFFLIVFLTNIIQAITGFAGNLLSMPFSILLIGVEKSVTILNILTIFSCIIIVAKNHTYINYNELKKIIFYMVIGIMIGIYLEDILPLNITLKSYALFIILIAISKLKSKKQRDISRLVSILIILVSGIIHGIFISGGSLLVIYAVNALKDKNEFRSTIALVWIILGVFLMIIHYKSGFYTMETITESIIGMIPTALGVYLGNKLYSKIEKDTFLIIVYILLIISGFVLLIK